MAWAAPPVLQKDDDGEGLAVGFFEGDLLLDAVVGEGEIGGLEIRDDLAGALPDECWDHDQGRRAAEGRGGIRDGGGLGVGKEE